MVVKFTGPCLYGSADEVERRELNGDFPEDDFFLGTIVRQEISAEEGASPSSFAGEIDLQVCLRSKELLSLMDEGHVGLFVTVRSSRAKCCRSFELTVPQEERRTDEALEATYRIDLPVREMVDQCSLTLAVIAKRAAAWTHVDPLDGEVIELELSPGRVCAYHQILKNFRVSRDASDCNIGSIFRMEKSEAVTEGICSCRLTDTDALTILVRPDAYDRMWACAKAPMVQDAFVSNVVLPSLTNVLAELYAENTDKSDFEFCRWYEKIEFSLLNAGIADISTRTIGDAFTDAQILLGDPIGKFLKANYE